MTDITTGRLGPVAPTGESRGNGLEPDAGSQRRKRRPPSSPTQEDSDPEGQDDSTHQVDELA